MKEQFLIYTTLFFFLFGCSKNEDEIQVSTDINGPTIVDIDGNVYESVVNCNQTWIKSNLNVSKYSDGTPIPQVTDFTQWANLTTGAWCYYNNDPAKGNIYGKLYNWYAVAGIHNTASATNIQLRKKISPTGWHIPTDAEWTVLTDCLGGLNIAGGKMKSVVNLWQTPNNGATNSSGFSGLPGSYRYNNIFGSLGYDGFWWSSTESNISKVWFRSLLNGDDFCNRNQSGKNYGFSIRCVKD